MIYQDFIIVALASIITLVIIPLIALGGKTLINYINKKVGNAETAKILSVAIEIITTTVETILLKYLDSIQRNDIDDRQLQEEITTYARETVILNFPDEIKVAIEKKYGNLEKWVEKQIESSLKLLLSAKNNIEKKL